MALRIAELLPRLPTQREETMLTNIRDCNCTPIPYNALLEFLWWGGVDGTSEYYLKCKIRKRKRGDIFEFVEDAYGKPCHFTHRLSALNWTEADLFLIDEKQ